MLKEIKGDALIESKELRDSVVEKIEVFNKVKQLSLLPDDLHLTVDMSASYYEVGEEAVSSIMKDHRKELEMDGLKVLTGSALKSFKDSCGMRSSKAKHLAIIPRRAHLRIGMLLRDSRIAEALRSHLLNVEQVAREIAPEVIDNALVRQKVRELEMKEARLEVQRQNSAIRQAKLMMEFTKEYKDKLSPESITAMLNAATTVLTGQPLLPPPVIDKTYTAEEIGKELGISSTMVGKIANKHDLKTQEYGISILGKSKHSDKQFPQWIYYEAGRKAIIEIVKSQTG